MTRERISGCIQLGRPRTEITRDDDSGVHYTVRALVLPYYGLQPKEPTMWWTLQEGIAPAGTAVEVCERQERLYGSGCALIHFEGSRDRWPYRRPEVRR